MFSAFYIQFLDVKNKNDNKTNVMKRLFIDGSAELI